MRVTPRLLLMAGLAVVSVGVVADTIPTVAIPENFFLGHPAPAVPETTAKVAAAVEKPQAINGAIYTVVSPIYTGTGGTSSYLRLFNGGAATATFTIKVVGSPSATTYGTATIQVPPRASPQYSMVGTPAAPGILDSAGVAGLQGSDTGMAFYIQSTESTAGYQHVTFNTTNLFFENASVCAYALNHTVGSVVNSKVITNIHTSLLPTYPSQVEIHNYFNAAVTFTVTVIEAKTGTVKGSVSVPIGANTTYIKPMSFFESQVGWTPVGGELHANLVVTNPAGIAPTVMVGQSIVNQ